MSEHEIVFGTPEHIAGLSRRALEEDFRWVQDRRMELENECERLDVENAKLRELVRTFYHCTTSGECDECHINGGGPVHLMPDTICDTIHDRMRELGVEV